MTGKLSKRRLVWVANQWQLLTPAAQADGDDLLVPRGGPENTLQEAGVALALD